MKLLAGSAMGLVAVMLFAVLGLRGTAVADPPVNSKVQDPATTFFGVFAGTDGPNGGVGQPKDSGGEKDPCRLDRGVGQWGGWAASHTTVLTEAGFTSAPCDATSPDSNFGAPNGQATEAAFRAAIEALKPGGSAPVKPVAGNELVVFVSAHGTCGAGTGQFFLDSTDGAPGTDGTVTAANLRDLLSGFPRSVTFTVILSVCEDGFGPTLMGIKDNNNSTLDPGHIEVLEASRTTEYSYAGLPVAWAPPPPTPTVPAGSNYTTAIEDCLANKDGGGKTVADVDFGNNDGMTWSLELHGCTGPLTTLISAYCVRKETADRYIADKSFGNNDGTMTAAETSKCALDSWRGGKAAIQSLVDKAKNWPQGIGPEQHPIFQELGNPDKDPAHPDIDGDGRSNVDEISTPTKVTNPFKADTDSDGLGDKAEIDKSCDAVDPDTDNDGILDSDEVSCPVGGILEPADLASLPLETAELGQNYTPYIAGAAAAGALLLVAASGWYGRRRWLR